MGAKALIAWLRHETVSPVTAPVTAGIVKKSLLAKDCTSVTGVTSPHHPRHSAPSAWALMPADQQEAYEERAAIIEYDGGASRAEAEASAWRLVPRPDHR